MAVRVPYVSEMIAARFPDAYVRIHSVSIQSRYDAEGNLTRSASAQFMIYASREARSAHRDPVGTLSVSLPNADFTTDLMAQAWTAAKAHALLAGAVDDLDPIVVTRPRDVEPVSAEKA